MADYTIWKTDAAENILIPPDGWPEHVPPRAKNDTAREMMSALARRSSRLNDYPLSLGLDANTYRLDIPYTLAQIPQGFHIGFTAHQTNAGESTFQVNTTTSHAIFGSPGDAVLSGGIIEGRQYDLVFEGNAWHILYPHPADLAGQVQLSFIPDRLEDIDLESVDGFDLSTEATGVDDDTLYFRTTNGGEILRGATRVESIMHGGTQITDVLHGSNHVYAIPRVVQTFLLSSLNNETNRITWTAPAIASEPLTYRVERADDADFSENLTTLAESTTALLFDDDDETLVLATTYYYRVRAENYIGAGPYIDASITTGGIVPGVPTSVSAAESSTSEITVSWGAPETGTEPFTYSLQRATDSTFTNGLTTLVTSSTVTSYDDSGLSTYTRYYYRVQAHNNVGDSAYVGVDDRTDANRPSSPRSFSASAVSTSQINLSWSSPSNSTGTVTYRLFRGSSQIYAGTGTSRSDTGLSSSTTYSYSVRAEDVGGTSNSVSASATTYAAIPSVPFWGFSNRAG